MYLYTRSLSLENASFRRSDLAQAGPAILTFLVFEILPISIFVFAFGILASIAVYGLFSWRLITRFHAALQNTRTDFDHLKLTWLKRLLGVQCAILVLNAASSSLAMYGQTQASQAAELLVFVGLASLVNLFLFHGLQYPRLFDGVSADELALSTTPPPGQDPSLRAVMTRIEDHLASSQVYLRPGLTVNSLGRQIRSKTACPFQPAAALSLQTGIAGGQIDWRPAPGLKGRTGECQVRRLKPTSGWMLPRPVMPWRSRKPDGMERCANSDRSRRRPMPCAGW
ncbi:MAG: hypothetical protein QUV02_11500 [Maricaulis sp.]|uniref:hypothetical protein n=1 Tax=Maricaulis sp. TaxID=1486257 RepID=UPI00262479C9|nr:hypothetical protein [Maricaulis sp.]MDM7985070.1 hypothetical protein [Maricaulis sp.]